MSCYEQFHWTPDDIRRLSVHEAELLAIYFEELAAYRADEQRRIEEQQKDRERQANTNVGGEFTTDVDIGADDEVDASEDEEE